MLSRILCLLGCLTSFAAWSQVNTFDVVTFEPLVTAPATKVYSLATPITLNGIDWVMPGVQVGNHVTQDYKIATQSARFRKVSDSTGANGYMEMQEDFTLGYEYFGFKAAHYGSDAGGKLAVAHSTDQGVTWEGIDTFNIGANNAPDVYEIHRHITVPTRFRITKVDAGNARINIDSIYCVPMAPPPPTLEVLSTYPSGRTHPSVDSLELKFNQHITESTGGSITLIDKTANTTLVFDLNHPDVTVLDDENLIKIANIVLTPLHDYAVLVDSTFVKSEYWDSHSEGIYDSTEWNFTVTLTHLDNVLENFTHCDQWDLMGIFKQYSVEDGSRRWKCDEENGNPFISMSGNNGTSSAVANEDWLVSYLKFDFNGRVPILKMQERKEGNGNDVTRRLMFTPHFNINISTTTWTEVATFIDNFGNDQWRETSMELGHNALLTQAGNLAIMYKNNQMNDAHAWKWSIDSFRILVDTTVAVQNIENIIPSCFVVNPVINNQLEVHIFSNANIPNAQFVIVDAMGRMVWQQKTNIGQGHKSYQLQDWQGNAGMYALVIQTPYGSFTKKFVATNQ